MELTSLLGYGACEPSLLLMWRLGLLDMLLPQHALYLRVRTNTQLHSCLLPAAPGLVLQAPATTGCSPYGHLMAHGCACACQRLPSSHKYRPPPTLHHRQRHKVPRAPRSPSRSRRPELLFELAAELDKHVHPQVGGGEGWEGSWLPLVA